MDFNRILLAVLLAGLVILGGCAKSAKAPLPAWAQARLEARDVTIVLISERGNPYAVASIQTVSQAWLDEFTDAYRAALRDGIPEGKACVFHTDVVLRVKGTEDIDFCFGCDEIQAVASGGKTETGEGRNFGDPRPMKRLLSAIFPTDRRFR